MGAVDIYVSRPFNDSLLKLFAETTKQDLILNNYVICQEKGQGQEGQEGQKGQEGSEGQA